MEEPLKKKQLLFHLQKINKVLGVGEGISLQFYHTKACRINPTAFQAAVKLHFFAAACVIHIPRAPRRGGNGFVMDTQCGGIDCAEQWLQRWSPLLKLFAGVTWSSVGLLPKEVGVAGRKLPLDYIASSVAFFS